MTATTARHDPVQRRRSVLFWTAALAGVVLLVVLAGAPNPSAPLSPRSTSMEGTKALVLFLEELGADVEVTRDRPGPGDDVAVVLADDLGDARRDDVRSWVRSGGVLVMADAGSALAAPVDESASEDGFLFLSRFARGTCSIESLADAETISGVGTNRFDAPASLFEVPDGSASCFGEDDTAFVVAEDEGDGTIVSIGDPDVFSNQNLDEDDNAVLAAAVLAPEGGERVLVLEAPFQERDTTLVDLIPQNVARAFFQTVIAFGLYALWRARRLGRPVAETQPVDVAGSELVAAVGGLLEVKGAAERAADLLRADLRRYLGVRFGLPPTTPPEVTARVVAERTGANPARVLAALAAAPSTTDAELTDLARLIDAVRQEVFHGHRA
ncbi:MAG: DUF4350 domain-containing protein [Acidimicrobiales bacterium]